MKIINLKEEVGLESSILKLDNEIRFSKMEGNNLILVVHGYGSHGKGGIIKDEVHKLLIKKQKAKQIKGFIPGEKWNETRDDRRLIERDYPELIMQEQLHNLNYGVTIILL